jgi:hypothetical protein
VQLPVVRKDFLVDPYQVWEARAAGAAAVLLIAAALRFEDLKGLLAACAQAGVTALVEVHQIGEVEPAVDAHAAAGEGRLVLGVNARDLTNLAVDPGRFEAVRAAVPDDALVVSSSGRLLQGRDQIRSWVQDQVERSQREEAGPRYQQGTKLSWPGKVYRDDWQQMGISPLEVTQDAIIREGKIHFFNTSFTPESAAQFQAARKKH